MENKKVLVVGISGAVGSAIAKKFLKFDYEVYGLVRDIQKAEKIFEIEGKRDSRVLLYEGFDLESIESVSGFISGMSLVDVYFDYVALAAGSFEWDNDIRKESPKPKEQVATDLWAANYLTKISITTSLKRLPKAYNKKTKVIIVGSHAANFAEDDERRLNKVTGFREEGYIASMQEVTKLARDLQKENVFEAVYLFEPGLIDTPMAREQFNEITIGENPDWDEIPKPEDFATEVATTIGLKAAA